MKRSSHLLAATITAMGGVVAFTAAAPAQAEPVECAPAGSTGLTAAVVAAAGQRISGTIDATGCDVGIYIGPDATAAQVVGATVTGANDHGIFVQDASGVAISQSTIRQRRAP